MRRFILLALGGCLAGMLGACVDEAAREREREEQAAVASLLQAERDFAATVKAEGIKAGFLSVLHPDGILFNPIPTNGIALYESAPESDALLTWEPRYVELASSLDFGYTTGPWEFFIGDTASEAVAFGDYFSIWKKDSAGVWKLALEIGVFRDAPQPMHELRTHVLESSGQVSSLHGREPAPPPIVSSAGKPRPWLYPTPHAAMELLKIHNRWRAVGSYMRGTSENIRIIRDSIPRIIGRDSVTLSALENILSREQGADISAAGDLGFLFGTSEATVRGPGGGEVDRLGGYVRVWRGSIPDEKNAGRMRPGRIACLKGSQVSYKLAAEVMSLRPKP